MDVRPFTVEHLRRLQLQPAQAWLAPRLTDDLLQFLAELDAYTGFDTDGEPIVCAGLMGTAPDCAMVWSYISERAGRHMVSVTKAVLRFLELKAPHRTELLVDEGFEAGYRWAELLGFTREGHIKSPETGIPDQVLFVRVRHG